MCVARAVGPVATQSGRYEVLEDEGTWSSYHHKIALFEAVERLKGAHPPSHHDCRYTQGILTQATVLFGWSPARLVHPRCQVDGADECVFELT